MTVPLVILAVFMAAYQVGPSAALLSLPVWIFAGIAVTTGAGLWLSALNVQYRDVRHTFTFLIQVWLFASPVVYASSALEGAWRYVFAVNPMVGVIDGFRWSLFADSPPPPAQDLISLAAGALLLCGGAIYFQQFERRFADVI